MLPLYLLNAVKGVQIVVEQKSRVTVEGTLENVDNWMNITVKNAVVTNPFTKESHKTDTIYIRGVQIKLIKLPNDVVDHYKEQQLREKEHNNRNRRQNNNQQTNSSGSSGNNNNNQRRYNNNNNNNNNNNRRSNNRQQQTQQPQHA